MNCQDVISEPKKQTNQKALGQWTCAAVDRCSKKTFLKEIAKFL